MKHLTVRGVPAAVAKALERERRRRNQSLNQTVLDALAAGLGVDASGERRNGLASLAGTWSSDQLDEFEKALAPSEQIDDELWR